FVCSFFGLVVVVFDLFVFFFFFSSRRRHTRSYGDWSSDVCSSDLVRLAERRVDGVAVAGRIGALMRVQGRPCAGEALIDLAGERSEERRVGKECRSRWWAEHDKKKQRGRREIDCASS